MTMKESTVSLHGRHKIGNDLRSLLRFLEFLASPDVLERGKGCLTDFQIDMLSDYLTGVVSGLPAVTGDLVHELQGSDC